MGERSAVELRAEADWLAPGTEVDGRYVIVGRIGRGGMGQVYEGRHLRLDRRVAIKILRADLTASPNARKRFEQEARAAAQIEHEHVVTVFDCGIDRGREPYLVMEYLQGQDLRALLREHGTLAAPRAVRLLYDACLGLRAAHQRGVIHRDVKPENLFVIRNGSGLETCKVLDFGLAKLCALGFSDLHTAAGLPIGTLHYMSPEQARGDEDIDERTDVYSCSVVLYEMLCGERPHAAESPHALLYKIIHEAPRRIEEHGAWLPPALADLVHRGLDKDPARRPLSIDVFLKLLEPFLGLAGAVGGGGETSTQDTQPDGLAPPRSRRASKTARPSRGRTVAGAVATAGAALIIGATAWVGSSRPGTAQAQPAPTPVRQLASAAPTLETARVTTPAVASAPSPPGPRTPLAPATAPTARRNAQQEGAAALQGSTQPPAPASTNLFERQNPYD